jgi:hypothetical protein
MPIISVGQKKKISQTKGCMVFFSNLNGGTVA